MLPKNVKILPSTQHLSFLKFLLKISKYQNQNDKVNMLLLFEGKLNEFHRQYQGREKKWEIFVLACWVISETQ